ncbi:MAG: aspartate kinase [Bradymonadaceae bacterium]|nr:aspartate kinase [Lujinxingiaceae bacterium]
MKILVQKFGGSSVSDLERIRKVAQKVVATRRAGYDLVVVVSAMGDTTDDLLEMAKALSPNPSRRELDMLLSVGERISMALLSMAVHAEGLEAVSLTGSQCGIITTNSHSNARIMDVRPFRVQDELEQGRIVIIAGYQGSSYRREVTTLGRGGSDTTAVALAAALGAEACEIYSDVDGIYSADPRVVLSARQLVDLSYDEMQEMARSGAKVLNEQAVEFARIAKIALYAKSTHQSDSAGTLIRLDQPEEYLRRLELGRPAVAVSQVNRGLWVQAAQGADHVMAIAATSDCQICRWVPGRACELFLGTENNHDLAGFVAQIEEGGADVSVRWAGLVSVVGQGIGGQPRWASQGHDVLAGAGVAAQGLSISLSRLSWVVDESDVAAAAQALHAAFVD